MRVSAAALGVEPGGRRSFRSLHGSVTVSWRMSSTSGADISSLRQCATATAARATDTLVLAFRPVDNSLDVTRIPFGQNGIVRLQQLLGRPVSDALDAIAASLHCRRDEVEPLLRRRGDTELLSFADD